MPSKRGPKSKLTPEAHKAIVDAVSAGMPYRFAAAAAGVTERALHLWLAAGRKGSGEANVQLLHALKEAQAKAVASRLRELTAAGEKQWQAHAWWLERMYPDEFGANRQEVRELQKQVAGLLARLDQLAPPESKTRAQGAS